jgi:hypothetical protein
LTSGQLYKARISGIITTLPDVTREDLNDKNKSDLLVKLLAVVQVSGMVFKVIVRATLGRPSSPLEIMTMAFAVNTFIFYLLSMDRPQNVNTPFYISAQQPARAAEMAMIAEDACNGDKLRVNNGAWLNFTRERSSGSVLSKFPHNRAYLTASFLGPLVFG